MAIRHFLKLADFTKDELNTMLRRAAEIKALQKAGTPYAPFGGKVLLIGNVFEQSFMQGMDWHLGSGLSIVLMIFVIASMAFMNRQDKENEGGNAVW